MNTLIDPPSRVKQNWYTIRLAEQRGGYTPRSDRPRGSQYVFRGGIKLLRLPRLTRRDREERIQKYGDCAFVQAPLFE